jgi:hypothetical protein
MDIKKTVIVQLSCTLEFDKLPLINETGFLRQLKKLLLCLAREKSCSVHWRQ